MGNVQARDLFSYRFVEQKVRLVSYGFAKKNALLPVEEREGRIVVAIGNPDALDALKEARFILGQEVEALRCPKQDLDAAIERVYHEKDEEKEAFIGELSEDEGEREDEDEVDLLDHSSDSPVIRLLNIIFLEAIDQKASDIHFEPTESGLLVRYRIDGVLHKRHTPPRDYQAQLTTRIKVLAKLDIAEKRLPQDGRIKLALGGRTIDFRVSSIPIVYGERIVLRILDKGSVLLGLDNIGMPPEMLTPFRNAIRCSEGIILVTGPTGSGKTTTLYSGLAEVNSSDVNIMTVEDPVEYKLPQIAQIGVNPKIGLTFAMGLRHILRQDPDVIMIGEIRDRETAEIAIQSSLTGHLVLSTLHTNDAPAAITRLVDMGVEPYLLSSSVLAVVAQRLLRAICSQCRVSYEPEEGELKDVGIEREALCDGVLWKGSGCEACHGLGYSGRIGIYEYMPVSRSIKQAILQTADATSIEKIAQKEGMRSLRQEGAEKVICGMTTTTEVLRVTRGVGEDGAL